MKRNQIKIVSDAKTRTLAFYIKNEQGKWRLVSNSSELSRKRFGSSSVKDCAKEIISIISSTSKYNRANRGVDITFEGEDADFNLLKETINENFSECNITCSMQKTRIAVAGKAGSGKTTLIESIIEYKELILHCTDTDGVLTYAGDKTGIVFYEIPGIGFGPNGISAARTTFDHLAEDGLTAFIYCLGASKVESIEEDFIRSISSQYPDINVFLVLTRAVSADTELYVDQLSKMFSPIRVIPILARNMKTKYDNVIPAYGIEDINHYIFEGK